MFSRRSWLAGWMLGILGFAGDAGAVQDGVPARDGSASESASESAVPSGYFSALDLELRKEWPDNRMIRFAFHGHSVPAGYFRTPVVQRLDSYPSLFHQAMCERYRTAVIDLCVTAVGGEDSESGARRFHSDVLALKPDLVFIDYCLNDRRIGLERAEAAWRSMIGACRDENLAVVLLTATPDSREDLLDDSSPLNQHARQIRRLGRESGVPVIDPLAAFRSLVSAGNPVDRYLSQFNHPNREGHRVVAELLFAAIAKPAE